MWLLICEHLREMHSHDRSECLPTADPDFTLFAYIDNPTILNLPIRMDHATKKKKSLNIWKVAAFIGAAVLVIAGILWVNRGTGKAPATESVNPAFGQYISSFTAGIVS